MRNGSRETFDEKQTHKYTYLLYFSGIPTYFMASLLEMSEWGGTDAQSLKAGIDSIFSEDGQIPMASFRTKLISITSDGASVNTGKISGLMTRFASDREWLVKIHCINHRVELAVKDAFTGSVFKEIDDFYSSNYYLLRGSGKIKTELKLAADVLEIQHYSLPKMTGTRFIGHRRRALTTLLNMWPAFDMAYENIKADPKTRNETKAKVTGLLKKFKNYRFLVLSCVYLDLLEQTTPVSKIFESNSLLPFEVKPLVKTAIFNLSDQIEDSDMLDSHLQRFK